jgi:hypothetical protein
MTPIDYNDPNEMWRNNGYDPYRGMSDEERMKAGCLQVVCVVGIFIVALLICALFGSCTTTKYVPVPEYHTDTLRLSRNIRDSIYLSDSIYVSDFVRSDTVYKTTERWHTQWRERIVRDTIYQSKRDSIPYPVEVIKEVPAKLTWWQQARLHIINVLMMFGIIWLIVWIVKIFAIKQKEL